MKVSLLFVIWVGFIYGLQAQVSIIGTVVDQDEKALAYVNILLHQSLDSNFIKGAVSEDSGVFVIERVAPGDYYLMVSALGYQHTYQPIQIQDDEDLQNVRITLAEDVQQLSEVEVVARKPLFEQGIDRMTVNVQNSVTASGSSALEILERSPGIQVNRMSAEISMQGKAGVMVMLNGKLLRIEGPALLQYLQNLTADQIKAIELITAPPASYSAEGDAGIINIQTRKNEAEGSSANASVFSAYGTRPKFGATFDFTQRKKQINVFADFSANHNYSQEDVSISRSNTFGTQVINSDVFSDRPAFTGLYNGRVGLEYALTDATSIGLLSSGYFSNWTLEANTISLVQDNLEGDSRSVLAASEINNWSHWMANANLTHRFSDESQISLDLDYLHYNDQNPTHYVEQNFDSNEQLLSTLEFESDKITPINFRVFKLDYQKQWSSKWNIESGLKGTLSSFTNDVRVSRLENDVWRQDPRFTDVYQLDEWIAAAYLSVDYKPNDRWQTKVGLRYENYDSDLSSEREGPLVIQAFGRLFPSFFMTYQLKESQQIQFSYNERISRPSFNDLAPAFFFWDSNTILAGNPTVRPTISRKVSTAFRHHSILLTIQFTDDQLPLAYQPELIVEDNLLVTRAVNMANRQTAMLSLNVPWAITSWWESRYNLAAYWQQMESIVEGQSVSVSNPYFTINLNQHFHLPKGFEVELSANARTSVKQGVGEIPGRISINTGLQKKLGSRGKLSLNWNDMFNWGSFFRINFPQEIAGTDYDFKYDWEGNVIRLHLAWQIGNTGLSKQQRRSTGSEEERARVE